MGFFKLYLDDYGDGIQYIVRKVQRASLTLSHDEIQREGIDIEDLLYCPLRYTGAIKEMTLECDAIGEDGLDMVAKFMLKHANHLVSLSLDDHKFQGNSQNNMEAFVVAINTSRLKYLSLNFTSALRKQFLEAVLRNPPSSSLRMIRLSEVDYDVHEFSTSKTALYLLPIARLLFIPTLHLTTSHISPSLESAFHGKALAFPWKSLPIEMQLQILRYRAPFLSSSQYASVINYAADPNTLIGAAQNITKEDWLSQVGCT